MNLPIVIYLIGISTNLTLLTLITGVVCAVIGVLINVWNHDKHLESKEELVYSERNDHGRERITKTNTNFKIPMKWNYWWFIPSTIFFIVCALIPSTKTGYAMLAGYGIESAAANPKVQTLTDKSFKLLDKVMSDYLNQPHTVGVEAAAR